MTFTAAIQQQRPALAIWATFFMSGMGAWGDCGIYHGWLVGVPINNPSSVTAWAAATSAPSVARYGAWRRRQRWQQSVRYHRKHFKHWRSLGRRRSGDSLAAGPMCSGQTGDYWAPINWLDLDNRDLDLGSSGPITRGRAGRDAFASRRRDGQRWQRISS